jgi:hypothetical protein
MANTVSVTRAANGWKVDYEATGLDLVEYYDTFKAAAAAAKEHMEELAEMEAEWAMDQAREQALVRFIEERGAELMD